MQRKGNLALSQKTGGIKLRERVLTLLREKNGEYLSGEEISKLLSVSRTAIWKYIQALRRDGYVIDSHPKRGYLLREVPDLLLPEEIHYGLKTTCFGKNLCYRPVVGSTNAEAKKLATGGCPEGTVVTAEEQNTGKGRLSRGWFSPARSGIWFSVVLRPPLAPPDAPKCTLLSSVAIAKAIRAVSGLEVGIKWPNDILYQGRKMVGILTELSAEMDAINYIVIGIGINVNIAREEFPADLTEIATSISAECGRHIPRVALLQQILLNMEQLYFLTLQKGFDPIFNQWRELSCTLGQEVNCIAPDRTFSGKAMDIDEDGALIVAGNGFVEHVIAGDVSIRPKEK